jgi:hypothetical protein
MSWSGQQGVSPFHFRPVTGRFYEKMSEHGQPGASRLACRPMSFLPDFARDQGAMLAVAVPGVMPFSFTASTVNQYGVPRLRLRMSSWVAL